MKFELKDPMQYGKARGIMLSQKYLPRLSPFKNNHVVSSIEEWDDIKENYGDYISHRVDMPIGNASKNAVGGTNGFTESIPELIHKVNANNPEGVVLILENKEGGIPRYENDGAFCVLFNMHENVIIELVGKGFDAHELTQGIACHERYSIPWEYILFIRNRKDIIKNRDVYKGKVNPQEYQKQRQERIAFLTDVCGYTNSDTIEREVPETYHLLEDEIFQSLLDDIILELMKQQSSLMNDGLKRFTVQGNIARGKLQVWEMFRPDRWKTIDFKDDLDR